MKYKKPSPKIVRAIRFDASDLLVIKDAGYSLSVICREAVRSAVKEYEREYRRSIRKLEILIVSTVVQAITMVLVYFIFSKVIK
jgi:hypothetical protein